MTLTLRTPRWAAALVAFAAIIAFSTARANHYILPCDDDCSDPRWVVTGSLATARGNHTATLLRNGKVLVAGGSDDNGAVLTGAELYDPSTGTWSITGSMAVARAGHFAFALPSGAVLILGGVGGDQSCCLTNITAELYDPDTGTWSPAGNRGPIVGIVAATMLQMGKVLVLDALPPYRTDAWLYDTAQQTWNPVSADPVYRQYPRATLLQDGRILVGGGTIDADEVVIAPGAELYDLATGAWTKTASPNVPRDAATETVLPDGSVLSAGGSTFVTQGDRMSWITYSVPLRSSESYDPDAMWRPVGDLNEARSYHTATLAPDGRVLIAGGAGSDSTLATYSYSSYKALKSAELYDPAAAAWTYTSSLNVARMGHTATHLNGGRVLVVGGLGGDSSSGTAVLSSAEIYAAEGVVRLDGDPAP
jgi:hypothetical protein